MYAQKEFENDKSLRSFEYMLNNRIPADYYTVIVEVSKVEMRRTKAISSKPRDYLKLDVPLEYMTQPIFIHTASPTELKIRHKSSTPGVYGENERNEKRLYELYEKIRSEIDRYGKCKVKIPVSWKFRRHISDITGPQDPFLVHTLRDGENQPEVLERPRDRTVQLNLLAFERTDK